MLITLLMAVVCGVLAKARGYSWWKWGLAGAAIDVTAVVLLALAAKGLGIDPRFSSGTNIGIVSAAVALIVPRVVALAVVYRFTPRKPRVARASKRKR